MKLVIWLIIGLTLGPSVLGIKAPSWYGMVSQVAGGLFLLFAGWEMRFLNLKKDRRFYFFLYIGTFLAPAIVGWFAFSGNIFMSMAMGISALPVAIQILREKGLYNSEFARRSITLASLCDMSAWLVLAFILPEASLGSWLVSHWFVLMFFVGLIVGRALPFPDMGLKLQGLLFAPLFFLGLGWKIDLWTLFDWKISLYVFCVAVAVKLLGTYFSARWAQQSSSNSWNYAGILNARGAMEILAAHYAYDAGLISGAFFSALVIVGVSTCFIAVPLVRNAKAC